MIVPLVGGFHHQFVRGVNGSQQSASQLSGGGSRKRRLMSALGHKRAFEGLFAMSALPPKVDIVHHGRDVRFVPKADIRFYSITSSARASNPAGTLMPSALAILRLIRNSNFVGCSTGSSLGLAPFNILSTKTAARRHN